jgi:MFS family permease
MPNLVPREHFPNAAALNSTAFQVAQVTGPLLAGLLIAHNSLATVYVVNAVSFGAVIVALLVMDPLPWEGAGAERDERSRVNIQALLEGLHFVRRTPILVWTIALDFLATFFSCANTLLPIFARDILRVGARGYGALAAAQAVGSVTAGLYMTLRQPIHRQGLTVIWAVVVYGMATVAFGISHWFLLSWIALAVVGGSDTVSTILRQTIRQLVSPDRLRGRMTAVNMIFFMGGPQLGEFEAGVVASLFGAPLSVISGGVACLLATAWVARRADVLRGYVAHDAPH